MRTRPTREARDAVLLLGTLVPDCAELPEVDPRPPLVEDVDPGAEDGAELDPVDTPGRFGTDVVGVTCGVFGFGAGTGGTDTVTGTVGVGSVGVGKVTVVTVGSGGVSTASAGATSVAAAATAQQRIGQARCIRLYNLHARRRSRPAAGEVRKLQLRLRYVVTRD